MYISLWDLQMKTKSRDTSMHIGFGCMGSKMCSPRMACQITRQKYETPKCLDIIDGTLTLPMSTCNFDGTTQMHSNAFPNCLEFVVN